MTSLSRAPIDPTPPSSSEGKPEVRVTQSQPSARLGKMPIFTATTKKRSLDTLPGAPKSWQDWDRISLAAFMLQGAVSRLKKAGLLKHTRVLSEDGSSVEEIRLIFDPSLWTEGLMLKVLSELDNSVVGGEK